jgi:hypothetical protein
MPADPGFDDIASNFTVNDYITVDVGYDETCQTGTGEGKLRFLCIESHLDYVDPILFPGEPAGAHLHHFFGNTSADENSTWSTLRQTGGGTCAGGPLNRTAYWFPAMIRPQNNKVVRPAYIELYYSARSEIWHHSDYVSTNPTYSHYTTYGVRNFPNGMWFIFGWKESDGATPYGVWNRGSQTSQKGTLLEVAANSVDLTDGSGRHDNIGARLESPGCWDGVLQPTNGRSLADGFNDGAGKVICPETHPYRVPAVTLLLLYSHNGEADYTQWYISSDDGHGPPSGTFDGGHTFHTDWFGAWDPDIQDTWGEEHLQIGGTNTLMQASSSGILCRDDKQLKNDSTNTPTLAGRVNNGFGDYFLPEATRYIDIPEVPEESPYVRLRHRKLI